MSAELLEVLAIEEAHKAKVARSNGDERGYMHAYNQAHRLGKAHKKALLERHRAESLSSDEGYYKEAYYDSERQVDSLRRDLLSQGDQLDAKDKEIRALRREVAKLKAANDMETSLSMRESDVAKREANAKALEEALIEDAEQLKAYDESVSYRESRFREAYDAFKEQWESFQVQKQDLIKLRERTEARMEHAKRIIRRASKAE